MNSAPDVTVVVPTIPPRSRLLERALASIAGQSVPPKAIEVEHDTERIGSAATRNRAVARVETEWVAFLDDDDEWKPGHLATLVDHLDADYVFTWYDTTYMRDGRDPLGHLFGRPWNPDSPTVTPMGGVLVRTSLIRDAGGFAPPGSRDLVSGDDTKLPIACHGAGGLIRHIPERTWWWRWDRPATHGLPYRYDAALRRHNPSW